MTVVIDPDFSVYSLVERLRQSSVLLNHRRTMSLMSNAIEDATLKDGARSRIFSGFQYLSKFLPQEARYRQLAAIAEHVYVFGVPDAAMPPIENLTYVRLQASDRLTREWFLVSRGPDFASALATEELSQFYDPDPERVFQGIWTFDLDMVDILEEWLSNAVGAPQLFFGDEPPQPSRQSEIIGNSLARMIDWGQSEAAYPSQGPVVQHELRNALHQAGLDADTP